MQSPIFILGTERSGSTWVANIFDSHPDVALFMEPFTIGGDLFAELPERNVYLGEVGEQLEEVLRRRFERLLQLKHSLCFRPGRSPRLRYVDRLLVSGSKTISTATRVPCPKRLAQFDILNLNTSTQPWSELPRKNSLPAHSVIKEVRLNFKARVLHQLFPTARYVVTVRDPRTQLASIERLLQRGHLIELRRSVLPFVEVARESGALAPYHHLLSGEEWREDLRAVLARWWIVNYGTLLSDLGDLDARVCIVRHEDISVHPQDEAERALDFAGVTFTPEVERYVRTSSSRPGSGHKLDTNRKSSEHLAKSRLAVDPELSKCVDDALDRIELPPGIAVYRAAQPIG